MLYPVSKPSITEKEIANANKALTSGWISSKGEFIQEFEEKFAAAHGYKYGVSLNSGTSALIVALQALGIDRPIEEVIVPDFTMVATALAPHYSGAKPVFVDCGDDLLIDIEKLKRAITAHTRVIMPVHIYGRICNMEAIMDLAKVHGIVVITDAAECHGVIPGGDGACYSFFGNKIITTGEGGMFVTNNKSWAEKVNYLKNMAFEEKHTFLHKEAGYNMRMTNVQAAIGVAQLERMDSMLAQRREIESWYDEYLPQKFKMPKRDVVWMYDIQIPEHYSVEELIQFLEKKGVESRTFFKPMSIQPIFKASWLLEPQTNALAWSKKGLYLPTYIGLTKKDVEKICNILLSYF